MGVYLSGKEEGISFNHFLWARILDVAQDYGWQPAGTVITEDHPYAQESEDPVYIRWNGNYCTGDFQTVTAEDANALADALEKALDDIPDQDIDTGEFVSAAEVASELAEKTNNPLVAFIGNMYGAKIAKEALNPFEHLSGENKQALKDFIALCREDEFSIC